jgi:hypothetical protein
LHLADLRQENAPPKTKSFFRTKQQRTQMAVIVDP